MGECMKKIAFIIPYFGKFNNYFELFLSSCKYNPTIDFLIFTDDKTKYNYPKNVKVEYMTFNKLKKLFQSKFDFKISLEKPYKLCDYKPAYGYVFSEYLKSYDFWGFCDTDLIFGDIRKFYTDTLLNKYDKIGVLGHCSIFRNNKVINSVFKNDIDGEEIYKKVFFRKENSSRTGEPFDEEFKKSINVLFENAGYKIYEKDQAANIYMKSSNFRLTTYNKKLNDYSIEDKQNAIFIFDKGKLFRHNRLDETDTDFLYIHLQSRKMKINTNNFNTFKIIPNSFDEVDLTKLNNEKIKHLNLHYFRLRSKNLIVKTKRRLGHE